MNIPTWGDILTVRQPNFTALQYDIDAGTAWIRLDRPEALNSFSTVLYAELRDAVRLAEIDGGVDTIVITGTGRAFATGGDLKEVLEYLGPDADPLTLYRFEDSLPFDTIRRARKTVIAAVNGVCMAGGLITALSADISIAVQSAVFAIPEARIGIGEPFVPAACYGRISLSKLKYLAFTGQPIDATEAERIGLITEVVPDDQLHERVRAVIGEVRQTSPDARYLYKQYIARLSPSSDAPALDPSIRDPNGVEGLQAFAERRPPRFIPA